MEKKPADICAYNVLRQFRDYGEEWNDPKTQILPLYEPLRLIIDKYHQGPDSQLRGYGIVKFPESKRLNWVIKKITETAGPVSIHRRTYLVGPKALMTREDDLPPCFGYILIYIFGMILSKNI